MPVPKIECNRPCSGDENQTCGALWRLSVYDQASFNIHQDDLIETTTSFESVTVAQSNNAYCIRLNSGDPAECPDTHNGSWDGDNISIFHNGVKKATAYEYFKNFEFCLPYTDIDIQNDLIELKNGGSDGVSIFFA